ncbi:nicotinate-nucleotide--dimethylbenzimidazole phosphoribosyltransferase [Pseudorhodobacter sp.]|uniref:nicotinate-nucleotide--dimethylbenzimidazole phosphoribosyltransferase n=1 Tax=Pseudorhodobacter sp. TaxID=1934400 RepID=UPI002B0001D4|nr:nicotinate-nucleotide--dimethylbenzimidazole phosphoribosyltransferase [Pseudorhodobacter sp.]
MQFTSLNTIADLVAVLPVFDETSVAAAHVRQNSLTKPPGSLGRLETLAAFMAGWRKTARPEINRAQALVFAGNHGVCAQGVNPYPQEVTGQMVMNFQAGGAAINQLCRANGADLQVIPLDLDRPTQDFTQEPAMSEAETLAAMQTGADAVDTQADVLILGEMGIGNSTVAAAMAAAVFGGEVAAWVGAGTGSDAAGIARKIAAVKAGLARHQGCAGMAVLAALGGREQAAICGAVLAARAAGIVVILDGFICTAAAAVLYGTDPRLLDHCLIGHQSAEPGHAKLLNAINKDAILKFDMRLGEGSGAALALGILRGALACHNGMATFGEAGVSEA